MMAALRYFFFTLFVGQLWAQPVSQPLTVRLKALDSVLTRLHEQAMFNGVVLVAEKGTVRYKKAFGTVSGATNESLTTSSSFNLASISKQFIALMIM